MKTNFSLEEIACWYETKAVILPDIQRSFVWNVSQIELLWDSILRGFPIGALTLAKANSNPKSMQLLDGQQRAVTIALGFDKKPLRLNKKIESDEATIKLFIDIGDVDDNEKNGREFIFRAITKSHPWGYQKTDNKKPLNSEKISEALAKNNLIKDYLNDSLINWYPLDANLPIPFSIFINNVDLSFSELMQLIKKHITVQIRKNPHFKEKAINEALVKKIHKACKSVLKGKNRLLLPALYLDLDRIKTQTVNKSYADEETDLLEQIFVRLNTAGTPINNEELNYSLLKNQIRNSANNNHELITALEEHCDTFINPARFITIAYRLWQCKLSLSFTFHSLRFKPSQFQIVSKNTSKSKNTQDSFVKFLEQLINSEIIKKVIDYISYSDKSNVGLPYPILHRLGHSAPEILFLIFYRFIIKDDITRLKSKNTTDIQAIISFVTLLLFFAKDKHKVGYGQILNYIWHPLQYFDFNDFWSAKSLNNHFVWDVPDVKMIEEKLELKNLNKKISKILNDNEVIKEILFNKDIVLYAQRKFLTESFKPIHYHLDDSQRPYDWDHIFPHSWIKNKKYIRFQIKEIYHSIGNFRAWPYSLNRKDKADSPKVKFNPCAESVDKEILEIYRKNAFFAKSVLNENNLALKIKEATVGITKEHCNQSEYDLHSSLDLKKLYSIIIKRASFLYKDWFTTLSIDKIAPTIISKSKPISKIKPIYAESKRIFDRNKKLYRVDDEFNKTNVINEGFTPYVSISPIFDDVYLYFELPTSLDEYELSIYIAVYGKDKKKMESLIPKNDSILQVIMYKPDKSDISERYFIGFEQQLISYDATTFKYVALQVREFLASLNVKNEKYKKELNKNMGKLLSIFID